MHFNLLPWDFIDQFANSPFPERKGIHAFFVFDPFVEKICINKRFKNVFESNKVLALVGNELTGKWCERTFFTTDLFGGSSTNLLVLHAEGMSSEVKSFFLEHYSRLGERFVIFSFGKNDKFFDHIKSKEAGITYKIKEPPFWEAKKLLNLMAQDLGIKLPFDICNYILEAVPNDAGGFVAALNMLKLHAEGAAVPPLDKVKELISCSRLNNFELSAIFSSKRESLFFKKLVDFDFDFDRLRFLFAFMQSRLLGMIDTSYLERKSRQSRYDREILVHKKLWTDCELQERMRLFGEMEIMAKGRDPLLRQKIRLLSV